MEPENAFSRLERTLWTVWSFISEAVTRLIRPQNVAVGTELNPCEEPAVTEEPPNGDDEEKNAANLQEIIEEEHPTTFSLADAIDSPFPQKSSIAEVQPKSDKDDVKHNDTPSSGTGSNTSDHHEATSQEKFHQTPYDDAGVLITQDAKVNEDIKATELQICVQDEMPKSNEYQHTSSEAFTDEAKQEKNENSKQKASAEDSMSALTGEEINETIKKMQINEDQAYPKEELTEFSPEEDNIDKGKTEETWDHAGIVELDKKTGQVEITLAVDYSFSDEVIVEEEEAGIASLSQTDEAEEEDMRFLDESKYEAVTEDENLIMDTKSETKVEDPKQGNIQDTQEDSKVFKHTSYSEEPVESDVTGKREDDAGLMKPQINTSETDVKIRDDFGDENQSEEVKICTDDKDSLMEILQTISSVTVHPEGETGQETSGELKSIPPGISEGQVVVSEELSTRACEETQEGVPGNNNEFGPDENTTQRLVEVGVYEEFKAAQLPEEVESEEQESFKNTQADCLLMHEHIEEKTENSEDDEKIVELGEVEHSGLSPCPDLSLPQETKEQLFEDTGFLLEDEGELCGSLMEMEIKSLAEVVRFDLNCKTTDDFPAGTEKQLIGFREDEDLFDAEEPEAIGDDRDVKLAEGEEKEFVDETSNQSFCQVENSNRIQSFGQETPFFSLEESPEDGVRFLEYGPVEKADRRMTVEGEKHLEAEEVQIKDEMELLAAELITERTENEDLLILESALSGHFETQEGNNQPPHRGLEIWDKEMIKDIETANDWKTTESKPEDFSVMSSGERTKHGTGFSIDTTFSDGPKVIEEILDSRLETPTSLTTQQINSQDVESFDLSEEMKATVTGSYVESEIPTVSPLYLDVSQVQTDKETVQSVDSVTGLQRDLDEEWIDTRGTDSGEGDLMLLAEMRAEFQSEKTKSDHDHLLVNLSESSDEVKKTKSGESSVVSEGSSGDIWTQDGTWPDSGYEAMTLSSQSGNAAESFSNRCEGVAESPTYSKDEVDVFALDFSPQKSRISVKNPLVRPPTNPRDLINMPSLEPSSSSSPVPAKVLPGLPLGGLGVGIKLPGLGAGFPVLKKTSHSRDENLPQKDPEPPQEEKSEAAMKEEPHKPKWMPPMHQGFGNPLMSELKTKLKKTSDE